MVLVGHTFHFPYSAISNMNLSFIGSAFANIYRCLGFWTGFSLRNSMIQAFRPKSPSVISDLVIGLCVFVAATLPITAVYQATQTYAALDQLGEAVIFATSTWFLVIMALSFFLCISWARGARHPAESAKRFTETSLALLVAGTTRWKLWGLVIAQAGTTGIALYFVNERGLRSAAALAAVWVPAILVALSSARIVAADRTFGRELTRSEKAVMSIQLTANMAVVALLIVGLVFYGAVLVLALSVLIVGGLFMWRVFASQSSTPALVASHDPEVKSRGLWRDASGATHIDGDGGIAAAHSGAMVGRVDNSGRVTDGSGDYVGQVGSDGKIR